MKMLFIGTLNKCVSCSIILVHIHFVQGILVFGECQEHYDNAISCLGFSVQQ